MEVWKALEGFLETTFRGEAAGAATHDEFAMAISFFFLWFRVHAAAEDSEAPPARLGNGRGFHLSVLGIA